MDGLGVFAGPVRRFPAKEMRTLSGDKLKVPHMGWNEVQQVKSHPLWRGIDDGARFYFVHSYFVDPADRTCVTGQTGYGIPLPARWRGIISSPSNATRRRALAGLALLANFIQWKPVISR